MSGASSVTLVACRTKDEARMVVYGLQLRGVRAEVRHRGQGIIPVRGERPFEIVVRADERDLAESALPYIWSGIRGAARAVDPLGRCSSCGYDMTGLEGKWVCPECGTDLSPDGGTRDAPESA